MLACLMPLMLLFHLSDAQCKFSSYNDTSRQIKNGFRAIEHMGVNSYCCRVPEDAPVQVVSRCAAQKMFHNNPIIQ